MPPAYYYEIYVPSYYGSYYIYVASYEKEGKGIIEECKKLKLHKLRNEGDELYLEEGNIHRISKEEYWQKNYN